MKTVLLIEDNTEIRENMGEILELAGYLVLLAADGKTGAAMAIQHQPHIVICDIMMPELDGYGVIHLLQKNPGTQNIPFIFMTAKAERTEMRRGMELGADDYITKPFSATELLNAVETRLKKTSNTARLATTDENKENIQEFLDRHEICLYKKKQRVYTERHHAFRLYYVHKGKVKIFKTNDDGKELITALCGPGDIFGYTALLEGTIYKESAEAIEDTEIAEIPSASFAELLDTNNAAARQLIKILAGDVTEKEEHLLSLAYSSLRRKVAVSLIKLLDKYKEDNNGPFFIKLSRENLAAIAGTAKESLIRTLSDFKEEKLIAIEDGEIIILEEKRLRNLLN